LVKAAPKVFVWAKISKSYSAYFQINKSVLIEYFNKTSFEFDEVLFVEIGEDGEIYLGREEDPNL
jgi:hypothetical protein